MVPASWMEGRDFKDKKVCIIEDVVTTGGQIILSANDLRILGAQIDSVLCVIQWYGQR
jgi:orotate phosphoribosyltransferase